MPPSERPALTVQLPDDWEGDLISNQDELIELLTQKLTMLIQNADEAEDTLRFMVRNLENASILGFGITNMKKLINADYWEIRNMLDNPEMTYHLMGLVGVPDEEDRLTWPQTASIEKPDNDADEMTLKDWVNEVTEGMYVPSWE